ncbi:hypothetical protein LYSHEL_19600 [Lysobacter helvus]|uniref:Uncharacterized protein n=3 Tax=Lysobacterales TaxID=135614 RepID=A0ABM7Q6I8_9GAMM|nr:hypothetical protein LYSCAS_19610 [Lysobacter caseinilyticus]BCT96089.1 hypothetical protein LYSHEL_19600 [Lysobacter helvus]
MPMPRAVRVIAWIVAGLLLLVVALYGVMVAINWNDEPPSVASQELVRAVRDRPAVPDQDNAFVFMLGMGAPPGADPVAMGRTRMAFLRNMAAWNPHAPPFDFPGKEVNVKERRSPAITAMAEACFDGSAACVQQWQRHPERVDQWLASESWLLERYLRLIQFHQWREEIPRDMGTPFVRYQHAINGQQLLLANAWTLARDGKGDAARALLDQDLAFWRMLLRSSDTTLAKIISSAAIRHHFALGNLVLRELHARGQPAAPPDGWRTPLTREERSMRRVLAGEATFIAASLGPSLQDGDVPGGRVGRWILQPMYKPQATRNLYAARTMRMASRMDADYRALPQALRDAAASAPQHGEDVYRAYNPLGYVLFRITTETDPMRYAVRVSDVEGERRAAMLAVELRAANATPADAARRIRASALKDPYTGEPMVWDAATQSVVFKGMDPDTRARHAILL